MTFFFKRKKYTSKYFLVLCAEYIFENTRLGGLFLQAAIHLCASVPIVRIPSKKSAVAQRDNHAIDTHHASVEKIWKHKHCIIYWYDTMSEKQGSIIKCLTASSLHLWENESTGDVKKRRVIFFWAPWHDQCKVGGPMDTIYESLAEATSTTPSSTTASHEDDGVEFWKVEAELYPHLCQKYQVTFIPTFLMVDTNGVVVDRIEGSNDPARLTMAVRSFLVRQEQPPKPPSPITNATQAMEPPPMKQSTDIDIGALTRRSPIILFMKGLPSHPRCGFSRQMCLLLDKYNVSYDAYDILTNEEVRQGLKAYSDWPTYPQLYVQGEFIGGLDICKELDESDELMKILSFS